MYPSEWEESLSRFAEQFPPLKPLTSSRIERWLDKGAGRLWCRWRFEGEEADPLYPLPFDDFLKKMQGAHRLLPKLEWDLFPSRAGIEESKERASYFRSALRLGMSPLRNAVSPWLPPPRPNARLQREYDSFLRVALHLARLDQP